MVPHPHVTCDPVGRAFVTGSRVPVGRLWAWHRGGATVETLVKRYPALGWAKVLDALSFAYDNPAVMLADAALEPTFPRTRGAAPPAAPAPWTARHEAYVRRPDRRRTADLIREETDYLVVELCDQRRVRWPTDGTNEILEFGSLNPANANYTPGGKVLRRV